MAIYVDLAISLRDKISKDGPISVHDFMHYVLQNNNFGYYSKSSNIVGKSGDFITSPEVSQLFGELVGLWCLNLWQLSGSPKTFYLVELGPGNGTMMKDLLRATRHVSEFHKAMKICLVEINKNFILRQRDQIQHHYVEWFSRYEDVPEGFSIIVANEFFDALPINQYTKRNDKWYINMVDLNGDKQHLFIDQFEASQNIREFLSIKYAELPNDSIIEIQDDANLEITKISKNIVLNGGAALIIDYGYIESQHRSFVSTLQAVKNHKYSPIFEEIGFSDITSHINFTAFYDIAKLYQARVYGPISQTQFLSNMHIDLRKNMLLLQANSEQKKEIISGYNRLISVDQMGSLFKVLALTSSDLEPWDIGF
jgi:NADH dehydrogenase [ubiquinone] 1 alpha subcomplex assembly factor 7